MGYRIYGDDIEPLNTVAQAEALSYSKNTIVSVLETGRTYQFDPASTATRDGIRVLTPAGGGRLLHAPWVMNATEIEFSIPTVHLPDLQAVVSHNWSASLMDGGGFTDNGNGTYSLAAAEAALRQPTGGQGATIGLYDVAAVSNQSIADGTQTYVTVKLTGSTAAYATQQDLSLITGRDEIEAYSITRVGNNYHVVDLRRQNVDHAQLACRMEWDTNGISKVPGTAYSSSASNRYLQVSAGKFHIPIRLSTTAAFDTSVSSTFIQIHGSTASGWTRTSGQTQINNTNYNDGTGTLATLTANQWGVRWVFMDVDSSGAGLVVLIGPNNGSEAEANAALLPSDLPPELRRTAPGVLISKIIIQKNAASITASWISNFDAVTQRQSVPVTEHNSLSGILGNGPYHLSEAERDAAIREASTSQSGLATAAQISRLNASPIVTRYYTPSPTKISLTTTPVDIVSVTHTPTLSTGSVIFDFEFFVSSDGSLPYIAHFHNYFDNTLQYKWTETGRADPSDGMRSCRVIVNNYTGAKTCKVQGREYSSSFQVKIHETTYMDGAASSLIVPWSCIVTEII